MIKIIVPGVPVGQGRPRFARNGRFVSTYDPPKSRAYKQSVAIYARGAMGQRMPTEKAVRCRLYIYRQIPKSDSKRRHMLKATGKIRATIKPDVDNVYKAVTDACTHIIWDDDNQIVEAHIYKQYSDRPRVVLEVEELEDGQ